MTVTLTHLTADERTWALRAADGAWLAAAEDIAQGHIAQALVQLGAANMAYDLLGLDEQADRANEQIIRTLRDHGWIDRVTGAPVPLRP